MISREQLRHCGFSEHQIQWMLTRGRLIRLHEAVFAVGHVPLASTTASPSTACG